MKRELEILTKVEEPEKEVWKKIRPIRTEKISDIYFNFPDIVFRVRKSNQNYTLTFKQDIFRGKKWLFSKEYESKTDINIIDILTLMQFKPIVKLEMTKYFCRNGIEIQKVKGLGLFLEVEGKNRKECWDRIRKTGIKVSQECVVGKPEMAFNLLKTQTN